MNRGSEDISVYEKIFSDYYFPILGYIRKYVIDEYAAEDIAQEVFMEVWKNREHIDFEERPIKPYLYKAAYNRCMNYITLRKRYVTLAGSNEIDIQLKEKILQYDPMDSLMLKDAKSEIQKCIDNLPERCREVFKYSRVNHKKNKEIAELLGITEKAVEKHITTALTRIREYLYEIKLLP